MSGIQLRETFDTVAALYDRARPRYPPALFDDPAELAGIGSDARVLEIGPGPGRRLPRIGAVRDVCDEIGVSGWFESPVLRQYSCDTSYTTAQHLDLMRPHSNHIALEPDVRASLLDSIGTLVDARPTGRVPVRYLFRLAVARTRAIHSGPDHHGIQRH